MCTRPWRNDGILPSPSNVGSLCCFAPRRPHGPGESLYRRCGVHVASCRGSGSPLCLDVAASMADYCGSSNSGLFRRCGVPHFCPHASDALARNGEFDEMFSAGCSRVAWLTTDLGASHLHPVTSLSHHVAASIACRRPRSREGSSESNLPKIGYVESWCTL